MTRYLAALLAATSPAVKASPGGVTRDAGREAWRISQQQGETP